MRATYRQPIRALLAVNKRLVGHTRSLCSGQLLQGALAETLEMASDPFNWLCQDTDSTLITEWME